MEDPKRLVDDFIMICGYASDNYQEGMALLERRQIDPKNPSEGLEKVKKVLGDLHPILGEDLVREEIDRLHQKYGQ